MRIKAPGKGDIQVPEGLSPEEAENFRRQYGRRSAPISSREGMVSQKAHEDAVKGLEEQVSDLRGKLEEARGELSAVKADRNSYRERFEAKVEELKTAEVALDESRRQVRELNEKVQALESRLSAAPKEVPQPRDDTELRDLKKANRRLSDELEEARSESASLRSDLDAAMARISELESAVPEEPAPSDGTVVRDSADTFTSSLFRDGRYRVVLSRDGSSVTFTPDVEGGAECVDGTIRLPRLPRLVGYMGRTEHRAYAGAGGSLTVPLRRCRSWCRHPTFMPARCTFIRASIEITYCTYV